MPADPIWTQSFWQETGETAEKSLRQVAPIDLRTFVKYALEPTRALCNGKTLAFQATLLSYQPVSKPINRLVRNIFLASLGLSDYHRQSSVSDKMPAKNAKATETFAAKLPQSKGGTLKHWDTEVKGFALFLGKRSKTWYFQKDVGKRTQRILIGRYPTISSQTARQTALGFALEMGRGAGKKIQIGAPTLLQAMEAYLARPKLRSETHRTTVRQQFDDHLSAWLRLPLSEITKTMVVERHRKLAATPSAANHTLKYFRTVWNYARRTHELPESPTMAIEWHDETRDEGDRRPGGLGPQPVGAPEPGPFRVL